MIPQPKSKHGMYGTRTYNIWHLMIQRCDNPNSTGYEYYGGRGIGVCDSWRKFINFYSDMGECPTDMTLDRIDSNRGYCKENCRWATRKNQQNNMRNNRILTYEGVSRTLSQWAEVLNISRGTLNHRIVLGWDVERCLTEKVGYKPIKQKIKTAKSLETKMISTVIRKARKEYLCSRCNEKIFIGEKYENQTTSTEQKVEHRKTHLSCTRNA